MTSAKRPLSPSTLAVSAGRPARKPGSPLNAPMTPATAFIAGGDVEYARSANPIWTAFEEILGDLEGGSALSFASGAAASSAIFDLVPPGGAVVAPRHAYHGSLDQLAARDRRGSIKLRLVDISNTQEVLKASADAALIWIESPSNPALEIADIKAISFRATANGVAVAVDNTFATPLRQRPLDMGADLVIHSASKLLSGHSDVLLGAVVTNDKVALRTLLKGRARAGAIPGVMESWLAARGVRTLAVRLDRAEANARELTRRLGNLPDVLNVRYPGFGTIVAFEMDGGVIAADKLTRASELIAHATSLGGVESTWERRRRFDSESDTVPESLVRLSVGIEDVDDLWADIAAATRAL